MHEPLISDYLIANNLQIIFKYSSNPSTTAKRVWVQPVAPDSATREDISYYDYEEEGKYILTLGQRQRLLDKPYGRTSCSLSLKDLV